MSYRDNSAQDLITLLFGTELEISCYEPGEATHDDLGNPFIPIDELHADLVEIKSEIARRIAMKDAEIQRLVDSHKELRNKIIATVAKSKAN